MNRIKQLRQQKNLSIDELSKQLKEQGVSISPASISKYERGARNPKIDKWIQLAKFFDVSVSYLQGISDIPYATVASYSNAKGKKSLPDLLSSVKSKGEFDLINKIFDQQEKYQYLLKYDEVADFLDHIYWFKRNKHDRELGKKLTYEDEKKIGNYYETLAMLNIVFIRYLKSDDKNAKHCYEQIRQLIKSYKSSQAIGPTNS